MFPTAALMNPFRTAVPFLGQTTQILTTLSPKRDCGPKRVKVTVRGRSSAHGERVQNKQKCSFPRMIPPSPICGYTQCPTTTYHTGSRAASCWMRSRPWGLSAVCVPDHNLVYDTPCQVLGRHSQALVHLTDTVR